MLVVDINKYFSHPDKLLTVHTKGVWQGIFEKPISSKISEIAAIFHDVGKLNPHFQNKLKGIPTTDYSHHAYLSAFAFYCYCEKNSSNILNMFGKQTQWISSILAIIAYHHGNLPNFPCIFKQEESQNLINFLKSLPLLPAYEFIEQILPHLNAFDLFCFPPELVCKKINQYGVLQLKEDSQYLNFFLETQFSFASLISSDKIDASGYNSNLQNLELFCKQYHTKIEISLKELSQNSDLNCLRTTMRLEAQKRIYNFLIKGDRLFALTAPTGSGKTMMLLTLAGEILKAKGNFRIIYILPFLSITEQVESVCNDTFGKELQKYILRIDSKSENKNFETIQEKLDSNPSPELIKEILCEQFAENIFDYPFIITTFVRFFETLMSNHNATLLKLPNFSKAIFLIDEIQALPPRLYCFFVAFLDAFCKKFDSYAIISTATMPNFQLPIDKKPELETFFQGYKEPKELLNLKYFEQKTFNRYLVKHIKNPIEIEILANEIRKETKSVLVILNTIKDTKDLFQILTTNKEKNTQIHLLNTHFTPNDRKTKILQCNEYLKQPNHLQKDKIILISTQLIEAGVDIDFPVIYRDLCPIPSLVQSAGRCNRHGKSLSQGKVIFFNLYRDGKSRADFVYRDQDNRFLNFAKNIDLSDTQECQFLNVQKKFFDEIKNETKFGIHFSPYTQNDINFVEEIKQAHFETIGKFKLINESEFGEEYRFYIPLTPEDTKFERLEVLSVELNNIEYKDFSKRRLKRIEIEVHLKEMARQIVQIRIKPNDTLPHSSCPCFGIRKLIHQCYNSEEGLNLSLSNQII